MIWVIFGTVAAIVVVSALGIRSLLPRRHNGVSADLLNSWLEEARVSGGRGSGVYIRVHSGAASLQIEVQGSSGKKRFVLVYPKAEWSAPYFERVQRMAKSAGFPAERTPAGNPRQWESMLVNFGTDVQSASNFAISVLTEVYGASLTSDCRVSLLKFPLDSRRD